MSAPRSSLRATADVRWPPFRTVALRAAAAAPAEWNRGRSVGPSPQRISHQWWPAFPRARAATDLCGGLETLPPVHPEWIRRLTPLPVASASGSLSQPLIVGFGEKLAQLRRLTESDPEQPAGVHGIGIHERGVVSRARIHFDNCPG